MSEIKIRTATPDDAAALLAIYAPIVEHTATSFEYEPPTAEDFRARIVKALSKWTWLVAERAADGTVCGYAYGTEHRARAAYQWSVETSVYLHKTARGQGIGKQLYENLLPQLVEKGFCNAYAGITLPNAASVALHSSLGFQHIGVFPRVGYKFGKWHDVEWSHLKLRDTPP